MIYFPLVTPFCVVPSHFLNKAFFVGVPAVRIIENLRIKATSSPMHIINENSFVFGLACIKPN